MDIVLYPIYIIIYIIDFHNEVYNMNDLNHQNRPKIETKMLEQCGPHITTLGKLCLIQKQKLKNNKMEFIKNYYLFKKLF